MLLLEINSVSTDFCSLLQAKSVGVCDIIPLLQVTPAILLNFSAPFLNVMFLLG
jgi:hypothetical protein